MEIVNKRLNEIEPYEKNPRKNDDAVQYVANSIKEFGFKVPIIIDKDGANLFMQKILQGCKDSEFV